MKYEEFLKRTRFTKEELLAGSWGSLIEDLPFEDFSRLPTPPLLMLDRITDIQHDGTHGRIFAEKDIHVDDWFFQCHFQSDPVQPGCLGVDAIWQLLGFYNGVRGSRGVGRALGCKEVTFFGQIRPYNKVIRYEVEIRRYTELKSNGTALVVGTGKVFVDNEHIYTIEDAKVGMFEGIRYPDYPNRSQNSVGGVMKRE